FSKTTAQAAQPANFVDPAVSPIPGPEPEDLDDSHSLPPYDEDTTLNFSPQRNSLSSSPLVDISLRTPPRRTSPAPTTASSPNPLTQFINFINPLRSNNPPVTHRTPFSDLSTQPHYQPFITHPIVPEPIYPPETVYHIPSDNLDTVPPVIINIEPLYEEPIRTSTPEAPPVNEPNLINEVLPLSPLPIQNQPPLPPPPVQNPPPLNNMAQNQALTDATNAINAIAVAMGQEDSLQDPITWIKEFRRAAKVNK
ncbi:39274_t:CDS:2, partial [Gigaspora margarita]